VTESALGAPSKTNPLVDAHHRQPSAVR